MLPTPLSRCRQELTKVGKIIGTVSYMSPEQIRGDQVDTRSDVFAFGILFYRMVTGDLPFAGPTQGGDHGQNPRGQLPAPAREKRADPSELERIITKCLRKDPDERYQDTRDLVVDLRNLRKQYDSGVSDMVSTITDAHQRSHVHRDGCWAPWPDWRWWPSPSSPSCSVAAGETPVMLQAKSNALAIIGFENKTETANWIGSKPACPKSS